ncbi:MAG: hypothetical protein JW702_09235 [Clostridiales bacterium]|nr:hypothetical protein [Clostridiales bacterium]
MIKESISYKIYLILITVYRDSFTVKLTDKLFRFLGRAFKNSKFSMIIADTTVDSSRAYRVLEKIILKLKLLSLKKQYENSIVFKFIVNCERCIENVFINSIVFSFLLDEEGCDGD